MKLGIKPNQGIRYLFSITMAIYTQCAFSANVFFTATDYDCVTDYVWESDGARNRQVPSMFESPVLSLTDTSRWAVLKMPNYPGQTEGKLFKYLSIKNNEQFGYGLHYRSDQGNNFLDVYSSGKVVFGILGDEYLDPTIKMYCRRITGIDTYWR